MMNGRNVSLAEWESRSNVAKSNTLTTNATRPTATEITRREVELIALRIQLLNESVRSPRD